MRLKNPFEKKDFNVREAQFSEYFHKARKNLILFSGILLGWVFVGIEVPQEPFPNVKIIIKSPRAIPWVLLSLIFYFLYRTIIEWHQSDKLRRTYPISKLDYTISILIPVMAILIYSISNLFNIEFGRVFNFIDVVSIFVSLITSCIITIRVYQKFLPYISGSVKFKTILLLNINSFARYLLVFILINSLLASIIINKINFIVYILTLAVQFLPATAMRLLEKKDNTNS